MSSRPRFAGDGRLRRPAWVSILRVRGTEGDAGDVIGEHGGFWDPFGRTDDGLFLAETFARADLERPRKAQAWYRTHAVVDLAHVFPDDARVEPPDDPTGDEPFHDGRDDILDQQRNVRWHLESLAHLSAERESAQPSRAGWTPHDGWDPRWVQPALRAPRGDVVWLGGTSSFEAHITADMQRYPRFEDVPRRGALDDYGLGRITPAQFTEQWWPTAHAAWQRIVREQIPILWMPSLGWDEQWEAYWQEDEAPHGRRPWGRLSADWHGLLELERRLLEPYVRRAAEREVWVSRRVASREPAPDGSGYLMSWEGRIGVNERRIWRSLLAPVYLQLLEALVRISEGHSGAAECRECGQPFLTLDARRSSFCNDRERHRYTQRSRRRRLTAASQPPRGRRPS